MILLDPDLDPDPARLNTAVAPLGARRKRAPWHERIPSKTTLTRFLREAQAAVPLKGEVTVLLTTDAAVRRLNRQFRSKNKATDVLSFPAVKPAGRQAGESANQLGDLAISVDTARRQAAEQVHALTCELKILILHGLLHLAGYDHETDSGEMARKELKLREKLRLPVGLIERASQRVSKSASRRARKPGDPA